MKRFILIAITCIVLDQKKIPEGYLTNCQGIDINGQVIFNDKIPSGKMARYHPYIQENDDIVHGKILEISDPPAPNKNTISQSSDTGKAPN